MGLGAELCVWQHYGGSTSKKVGTNKISTNHEMAQPPCPMIHKEGLEQESSNMHEHEKLGSASRPMIHKEGRERITTPSVRQHFIGSTSKKFGNNIPITNI